MRCAAQTEFVICDQSIDAFCSQPPVWRESESSTTVNGRVERFDVSCANKKTFEHANAKCGN